MQRMLALVAIAGLAACADHGSGAASVDAGTDSGSAGDAAPGTDSAIDAGVDSGSGSAADMPAMLVVGASNGTVTDSFRLAASGTAGSPYGAISFSADVGTIDLGGGPAAGFVYATVPMAGYTLYDGFAVSATSWDAFYLYCNGTTLADVYDERVSGHGMIYAAVSSGACSVTSTQTAARVALPAFSIPTPTPIGGYTVSGNAIDIAGGTGTVMVGAKRMPLVVFDDVDCSACGGAGWYELHSVIWDAAAQRAVFVIIYLINGQAGSVELAYARSLPDLADPFGTRTLDATWSAAPSPRIQPRGPLGVAPPSLLPALGRNLAQPQ